MTVLTVALLSALPIDLPPPLATGQDTVRVVEEAEFVVRHRAHEPHEWRFDWEASAEPPRAFITLWQTFDDPELDDRLLIRQELPGLAIDGDELVWVGGDERVVCARIRSDFWSGYGPELRDAKSCSLTCEHQEIWVETETGLRKALRESVRLVVS